MFGNPEWFTVKEKRWGVTPVDFRGWAFHGAWVGVIGLVFMLLIGLERVPESLIWALLSCGAYAFEVRSIAKRIRAKEERDRLFYIGDEPEMVIETEEYRLQSKGQSQEA